MSKSWELHILDAAPPTDELGSITAGDIDGDGRIEIVTGGNRTLLWYRPSTLERGIIAEGHYHVGVALEDIDHDGLLEVVLGEELQGQREQWSLVWYKPSSDLTQPWIRHVLDPHTAGGAHDVIFADVDGDGERELVANAVYSSTPGLYLYKRNADPTLPWRKHTIQPGIVEEGLAVADLDGDGYQEIISGPDWFIAPVEGPFADLWVRKTFAPSHREMCRVALTDITGNGSPDIVLVDSEYMDGRLSWFENRLQEDPAHPWKEHCLEQGLVYAHSLSAWRDPQSEALHIFVAEMGQGGWNAPPNRDARLIEYISHDQGTTWRREELCRGEGTHQAFAYDVDGDGRLEIIGKDAFEQVYNEVRHPKVQLWKQADTPSPLSSFRHQFLDRDKPTTAIDIFGADLRGSGRQDVVCGSWWYRNGDWQRFEIPGIYQAINAYDIDRDGRVELLAIEAQPGEDHWYMKLSSRLCWLKPIDPERGLWEKHTIGIGSGDWPHGTAIGPILPGGKLALIVGYHSAQERNDRPEIFLIPDDPRQAPWPKQVLADVPYGEEFAICDIDGNGKLDIVAGKYWLANQGNGQFQPYHVTEGFEAARLVVADVNGNGRLDIIMGEEVLDFEQRITPKSRLAWFENPPDPRQGPWKMHIIDTVRCAHSIGLADLDGDGEWEIICGEHDPFWPYRSQCRLYVYKKCDQAGLSWKRFTLDDRFEHHDGAKPIWLEPERPAIVSHGWQDNIYVHLWTLS